MIGSPRAAFHHGPEPERSTHEAGDTTAVGPSASETSHVRIPLWEESRYALLGRAHSQTIEQATGDPGENLEKRFRRGLPCNLASDLCGYAKSRSEELDRLGGDEDTGAPRASPKRVVAQGSNLERAFVAPGAALSRDTWVAHEKVLRNCARTGYGVQPGPVRDQLSRVEPCTSAVDAKVDLDPNNELCNQRRSADGAQHVITARPNGSGFSCTSQR